MEIRFTITGLECSALRLRLFRFGVKLLGLELGVGLMFEVSVGLLMTEIVLRLGFRDMLGDILVSEMMISVPFAVAALLLSAIQTHSRTHFAQTGMGATIVNNIHVGLMEQS